MGRRQRRRLRGGKLAPERPLPPVQAGEPPIQAAQAPIVAPGQTYYPPFVGDDEPSRRRYDAAVAAGAQLMEAPSDSYTARLAARSLYLSDIPT
jgi:hypothetical protein